VERRVVGRGLGVTGTGHEYGDEETRGDLRSVTTSIK
jgi:hypothetical protein